MPGGSAYPGPPEALERYTAVVDGSASDCSVKGAKNPYTSRNGHMFSFLDADGVMALRLSGELGKEFLARYDSGPVVQYGSVMQGYVSVPDELLHNTGENRRLVRQESRLDRHAAGQADQEAHQAQGAQQIASGAAGRHTDGAFYGSSRMTPHGCGRPRGAAELRAALRSRPRRATRRRSARTGRARR